MYCRKCGHELPEGAAYCDRCGTATQDNGDAQVAAKPQKPGCLWRITHGLAWIYLICILALIGIGIYVVIGAYRLRPMEIHRGAVSTVALNDLYMNYDLDAEKTGSMVEGQRLRLTGICVARSYLDSGTIALGLNSSGLDYIILYVECPADQWLSASELQQGDQITIVCTILGYDPDDEIIFANDGIIE